MTARGSPEAKAARAQRCRTVRFLMESVLLSARDLKHLSPNPTLDAQAAGWTGRAWLSGVGPYRCVAPKPERPTHEGVTTTEAVAASGLSHRQILYAVERGWIAPSGFHAEGSGNHWRWTDLDVRRLRAAHDRLAWGLTPEAAFTPDLSPCPPFP